MNQITPSPASPDFDIASADVKVRMDRSRTYAEVHGQRSPGDPHQTVHFYQEGLPYDAEGFLIFEHPDYQDAKEGAKRCKKRDQKVQKALAEASKRGAKKAEVGDSGLDEDLDEDADDGAPQVDIDKWIRGEANYDWQFVTDAITARFSRRCASQKEAAQFLMEEMRLQPGDIARKFQKMLGLS